MLDQREIWWGIVAPPVVMAGGLALTYGLPWLRRWLSMGMVLALVYAFSQFALNNWHVPSGNVHDWPIVIALGAGLLTLFASGPHWWRIGTRVVFSVFAVWLLMRAQWHNPLNSSEVVQALTVLLIWITIIFSWERAYKNVSPIIAGPGLSVIAIISAMTLLLFNTLTHAQYAAVLAGALIAATVMTYIKTAWWRDQSMVTVSSFILPSLWILGCFYANVPLWAPPFLAVAGLVPWLLAFPRVRSLAAWKQVLVMMGAAGLAAAPVIIWGVITSVKAAGQQSDGY